MSDFASIICKHGVVLPPALCNLYIDRLLVTLKNSRHECHIYARYMGALSYVNDITLCCPCVLGMNKINNIWSDFAINNFITFNA